MSHHLQSVVSDFVEGRVLSIDMIPGSANPTRMRANGHSDVRAEVRVSVIGPTCHALRRK